MKSFVFSLVNKFFDIFGYHLVARKNLRYDLKDFLGHIVKLGFQPGAVIDVGVGYGTHELYESFPRAKHILIEPLKEFEENIKEIAKRYDVEYFLSAAGSSSGNTMMNVHPDLEGSSIFKEMEGEHVDGFERSVPVVTLDEVCAGKQFISPFLLKIDVQGAEMEVLEGARRILEKIEVIIVETSLYNFFKTGPQIHDVISYMKSIDYVAHDVFGPQYRLIDGSLSQIDIAFVKENSPFRRHHVYATKEQRQSLVSNRIRKKT
jgi:FkbM family methyltransferase